MDLLLSQHPSHTSSSLTLLEVTALHEHIRDVTKIAVQANASSKNFPPHWLFSWRWGKGKKDRDSMVLVSPCEADLPTRSFKWRGD